MKQVRFIRQLTLLNLGKLCQQRLLLAGLALLCYLLPLTLAPAAESVLAQGISFSGVKLAITAPEGDPVPRQLEQILPNMSDVRQYCQVQAMNQEDALESLARGEVTAILSLPSNFIQGIMNGSNPDVYLIVRGDQPLDALLTFWLGQSASDMLAAFQSGIYAVLELYQNNPPDGLSYQQVVAQINLRYVTWMMNRQNMFHVQMISATDQLPIGIHYSFSLLAYFILSLSPFYMTVYTGKWVTSQCRFRSVGWNSCSFYAATLTACWILDFLFLTIAQLALFKDNWSAILPACALSALFCATFSIVCCLLTSDTGSCGLLSFGSALVFLFLSGGVLPPVLMPQMLQKLIPFCPITWLRNMLASSMEDLNLQPQTAVALAVSSILMAILGWMLYYRRSTKEVT